MGARLTRFSEVVGDAEDALTPPVSSEGSVPDDQKGDFIRTLKNLEQRLRALELRLGDLPSAPAKTAEQFAAKVFGRRTEAELRESKEFCKKITRR